MRCSPRGPHTAEPSLTKHTPSAVPQDTPGVSTGVRACFARSRPIAGNCQLSLTGSLTLPSFQARRFTLRTRHSVLQAQQFFIGASLIRDGGCAGGSQTSPRFDEADIRRSSGVACHKHLFLIQCRPRGGRGLTHVNVWASCSCELIKGLSFQWTATQNGVRMH
jgi:hypothetical protein